MGLGIGLVGDVDPPTFTIDRSQPSTRVRTLFMILTHLNDKTNGRILNCWVETLTRSIDTLFDGILNYHSSSNMSTKTPSSYTHPVPSLRSKKRKVTDSGFNDLSCLCRTDPGVQTLKPGPTIDPKVRRYDVDDLKHYWFFRRSEYVNHGFDSVDLDRSAKREDLWKSAPSNPSCRQSPISKKNGSSVTRSLTQ